MNQPLNAPEKFDLTPGERNHPLWLKLHAYAEKQLDRARKHNDKILSEAETATLRGEIAVWKKLISLGKERPVIEE